MDCEQIIQRINAPRVSAAALLPSYETPEYDECWDQSSALYLAFLKALIRQNHPALALRLARKAVVQFPEDVELHFRQALAYSRGGNLQLAEVIVRRWLESGKLDRGWTAEFRSQSGRILKGYAQRTKDESERGRLFREAAEEYCKAVEGNSGSFYPAINAATTWRLAGEAALSAQYADKAVKLALERIEEKDGASDYWALATLGEGYLLQQKMPESKAFYDKALSLMRKQNAVGDIGALRRNLQMLRGSMTLPSDFFDGFQIGSVVVFAGHMIDAPDRAAQGLAPRFPNDPTLVGAVRNEIARKLAPLNARIGFCSLACGSDVLFAETMMAQPDFYELHVVLPFHFDDFARTSIHFGDESLRHWEERARDILNNNEGRIHVHYATKERYFNDEGLFSLVNRFTQGLATIRAEEFTVDPVALVVLDPSSNVNRGGAAYFKESWTKGDRKLDEINLAELRAESGIDSTKPAAPARRIQKPAPMLIKRVVKAMLFADVKGFSEITDEHLAEFMITFFNGVRQIKDEFGERLESINTWGDAVFAVFRNTADAADFALQLLNVLPPRERSAEDSATNYSLRVGLHAGPVFEIPDSILGGTGLAGREVSRAARIEPVTVPGCAFASEQFAALLTEEARDEYVCETVGIEALAKGFDDKCPLYRIARR